MKVYSGTWRKLKDEKYCLEELSSHNKTQSFTLLSIEVLKGSVIQSLVHDAIKALAEHCNQQQATDVKAIKNLKQHFQVDSHNIPMWVKKHITKHKEKRETHFHWLMKNYSELMDHWGSIKHNGVHVLITEPYHYKEETVKAFADLIEADYTIGVNSFHGFGCHNIIFKPRGQ